jgi:hypothetical protein
MRWKGRTFPFGSVAEPVLEEKLSTPQKQEGRHDNRRMQLSLKDFCDPAMSICGALNHHAPSLSKNRACEQVVPVQE